MSSVFVVAMATLVALLPAGAEQVVVDRASARMERIAALEARRSEILDQLTEIEAEMSEDAENMTSLIQVADGVYEEAEWHNHNSCTGSGIPHVHACYQGKGGVPYVGSETIKMYVREYSQSSSSGKMDVTGWGKKQFSCRNKYFGLSPTSQTMMAWLNDCMPSGVTIQELLYCKNQNQFKVAVHVADYKMTLKAFLKQSSCR